MTDQLPGRTPPWMTGVWTFPPARPQANPVRIGDAERDEALDKLGDHFAAGRLTRDELDERSDTAMQARYDSDLEPLFRDLPDRPREVAVVRRNSPRRPAGLPATVMLLVPLLVIAITVSLVLHGPIFFGPVIWLLVLSGMGRRHHHR